MNPGTRAALEVSLGARVLHARSVAGGDINAAYAVELEGERRVFVKCNERAPHGLFEAERRGLAWLAAAGALRVPEALACGTSGDTSGFLVLEWIEPGSPARDFDVRFGEGLASLHRSGSDGFGLDHDNFIALLPQDNRRSPSWADFYCERRLAPLVALAARRGLLDARFVGCFEALFARLPELVGPEEPPARLHGDLWGGNLHVDAAGLPVLIDPAVYAGHREVDWAMLELFGGFGARAFDAYANVYPFAPGRRERVALYQLYPLLVHVLLFGAGYLGRLQQALTRYA